MAQVLKLGFWEVVPPDAFFDYIDGSGGIEKALKRYRALRRSTNIKLESEGERRLAKAGYSTGYLPFLALFIVPIYPFARAKRLKQVPRRGGKTAFIGTLGKNMSLEDAQKAALLCSLNILSQIKAAVGDLDHVSSVIRLVGYVASTPDFTDQNLVMNGASDLMVETFGEAGRHARTSVGVAALPKGVPVEVEATIELFLTSRPVCQRRGDHQCRFQSNEVGDI